MTIERKGLASAAACGGFIAAVSAFVMIGCGGGGGGGGGLNLIPPDPVRPFPGTGINGGLVTGKTTATDNTIASNSVSFDNTAGGTFRIGFGDAGGTAAAARTGMVAMMRGTFLSNDTKGTYTHAILEPQVIGTIEGFAGNASAGTFTVLGQSVEYTRFTIFDVPANRVLADGDIVEVHGFFNAASAIEATFIQRRLAGTTDRQLRGVVTPVDANNFLIGTQSVNRGAQPLPALNDFVEVEGTQAGAILNATKVEVLNFSAEAAQEIEIEGTVESPNLAANTFILRSPFGPIEVRYDVAGFFTPTRFELEERNTLSDENTVLVAGGKVEVEGRLAGAAPPRVLQAREIELRRSENVVLEGNITNLAGTTFNLRTPVTTVQFGFALDAAGALITPPGSVLSNNAHVEVGGNVLPGSAAIAVTRVTVITDPLKQNDIAIQGPVTAHGDGVVDNTITILGKTVDTLGLQERDDPLVGPSEYENAANQRVTKAQFFGLLQNLVTVVNAKAKDDAVSPPFNGALLRPRAGVDIEPHR